MTITIAAAARNFKGPITGPALASALAKYGPDAEVIVTTGKATKRKGSNCDRAAKAAGFSEYEIVTGARAGRNLTDGYFCYLIRR